MWEILDLFTYSHVQTTPRLITITIPIAPVVTTLLYTVTCNLMFVSLFVYLFITYSIKSLTITFLLFLFTTQSSLFLGVLVALKRAVCIWGK